MRFLANHNQWTYAKKKKLNSIIKDSSHKYKLSYMENKNTCFLEFGMQPSWEERQGIGTLWEVFGLEHLDISRPCE